jgi:hypothetical protein
LTHSPLEYIDVVGFRTRGFHNRSRACFAGPRWCNLSSMCCCRCTGLWPITHHSFITSRCSRRRVAESNNYR